MITPNTGDINKTFDSVEEAQLFRREIIKLIDERGIYGATDYLSKLTAKAITRFTVAVDIIDEVAESRR